MCFFFGGEATHSFGPLFFYVCWTSQYWFRGDISGSSCVETHALIIGSQVALYKGHWDPINTHVIYGVLMILITKGSCTPRIPRVTPICHFPSWESNGFFWGPKKGMDLQFLRPFRRWPGGWKWMMARGWVICWQDRIDLCLCQACFNASFFLFQAFFFVEMCFLVFFFLRRGAFGGFWLVGHFLKWSQIWWIFWTRS